MLRINRVGAVDPSEIVSAIAADAELSWQRENGSRVWTLGNPMLPGLGVDNWVWEPPDPTRAFVVRRPVFWAYATNPFVGAGGATTVGVGTEESTTAVALCPSTAIAAFGARLQPTNNSFSTNHFADLNYFGRAGTIPGFNPAQGYRLWARCDAGSVSGTMGFSFEWKYVT